MRAVGLITKPNKEATDKNAKAGTTPAKADKPNKEATDKNAKE